MNDRADLRLLVVNMLLQLYYSSMKTKAAKDGGSAMNGHVNGRPRGSVAEERRLARDAEEFELAGLMSDDEDGASSPLTKERPSESSRD